MPKAAKATNASNGSNSINSTVSNGPRFLTLEQVSEELNVSPAQTYALVRSGSLEGLKIGGRGQWRVARADLESYISRAYREAQEFIAAHPFGAGRDPEVDEETDHLDRGRP